MWEERLKLYDAIIDKCPDFGRKGKNMVYTSANGYMFSQLNKDGEIGIRLSKESAKKFMEEHNTGEYRSYGAVMREYVRVPEHLLDKLNLLAGYLNESYQYVMALPPKSETGKK